MDKGTKKIILQLSVILILFTVGCGKNSSSLSLNEQLESDILSERVHTEEVTTTEIEQIVSTQPTNAETTELPMSEESLSERKIIEAIAIEIYGELNSPYPALGENNEIIEYENDADYLMHKAETFPEKCLGSVLDEEDLIEKARTVWMERLGTEYIDHIESEYVEEDGVKIRFERHYPPYRVKYYEEYDVWYIVPTPPSGIREDGVDIDVIWDFPPYLIIRGEDGMILGAFI